jgi:hypothetical protein
MDVLFEERAGPIPSGREVRDALFGTSAGPPGL